MISTLTVASSWLFAHGQVNYADGEDSSPNSQTKQYKQ